LHSTGVVQSLTAGQVSATHTVTLPTDLIAPTARIVGQLLVLAGVCFTAGIGGARIGIVAVEEGATDTLSANTLVQRIVSAVVVVTAAIVISDVDAG